MNIWQIFIFRLIIFFWHIILAYQDGRSKHLVALGGTIPVSYLGSSYNIPIDVLLLEEHPYASPLIYVKPTPTMQIKTSSNVDTYGRVYLPYLSEWSYVSCILLLLCYIIFILKKLRNPLGALVLMKYFIFDTTAA